MPERDSDDRDPTTGPDAGSPGSDTLTQHVDKELFAETFDDLEAFLARKQAVATPQRYAVLYYLYDCVGGDTEAQLAEQELRQRLDLDANTDLHGDILRPLLDTNVIARIPAPERRDGADYYRLTTLGRRTIEADQWAVHGTPFPRVSSCE